MAAAAACWLEINKFKSNVWKDDVKLIIVEPLDANCISYNAMVQRNISNRDVELIQCVGKTNSIMSGLNCGTPSKNAFDIIKYIADYYISIGDEWAKVAMRKMYKENIISGESGAAGVASVISVLKNSDAQIFDKNSVILTINTEADTDKSSFEKIVTQKLKSNK